MLRNTRVLDKRPVRGQPKEPTSVMFIGKYMDVRQRVWLPRRSEFAVESRPSLRKWISNVPF